MINRSRTICTQPGCWAIVDGGKCPRHRRKSSRDRGYDWKWEVFRSSFLAGNPVCCNCGEKHARMHVHHKIDLKSWPKGRMVRSNCMTLCQPCHNIVTRRRANA